MNNNNPITKLSEALTTERDRNNQVLQDAMTQLCGLIQKPNGMEWKRVMAIAIDAQKTVNACQMLLDGWT